MKYKLYHEKDPDFGVSTHKAKFPEDFEHVADVEAETLHDVFSLTNHIDDVWYKNEGVTVIKESRSTSVGDIVVDEAGVKHRCDPIGWTQI